MTSERKEMKQNVEVTTTETTEMTTEEKQVKKDHDDLWIDLGGEG